MTELARLALEMRATRAVESFSDRFVTSLMMPVEVFPSSCSSRARCRWCPARPASLSCACPSAATSSRLSRRERRPCPRAHHQSVASEAYQRATAGDTFRAGFLRAALGMSVLSGSPARKETPSLIGQEEACHASWRDSIFDRWTQPLHTAKTHGRKRSRGVMLAYLASLVLMALTYRRLTQLLECSPSTGTGGALRWGGAGYVLRHPSTFHEQDK